MSHHVFALESPTKAAMWQERSQKRNEHFVRQPINFNKKVKKIPFFLEEDLQ